MCAIIRVLYSKWKEPGLYSRHDSLGTSSWKDSLHVRWYKLAKVSTHLAPGFQQGLFEKRRQDFDDAIAFNRRIDLTLTIVRWNDRATLESEDKARETRQKTRSAIILFIDTLMALCRKKKSHRPSRLVISFLPAALPAAAPGTLRSFNRLRRRRRFPRRSQLNGNPSPSFHVCQPRLFPTSFNSLVQLRFVPLSIVYILHPSHSLTKLPVNAIED